MTQILQDFIAKLDLSLPWLLPALETVEQAVPSAVRLSMCVALIVGFFFLRHRNTATAASRLVAL